MDLSYRFFLPHSRAHNLITATTEALLVTSLLHFLNYMQSNMIFFKLYRQGYPFLTNSPLPMGEKKEQVIHISLWYFSQYMNARIKLKERENRQKRGRGRTEKENMEGIGRTLIS